MRIYIIAGEESGDLHGSNLVSELILKNNDVNIRAWGGDRMKLAGANVIKHINDISFMGFSQVLLNIRYIYQNLIFCRRDIISFKPDAIILIDYPGFNLRIARFAKKHGIKVFYYISPKVWAWRTSRVEVIKRYVDKLIVIFPFEVDFFKKHGITAHYFGNPISDEIIKEKYSFGLPSALKDMNEFHSSARNPLTYSLSHNPDIHKNIIVLVPGSREREVRMNLPIMLAAAGHFIDNFQIVIAATDNTYNLCLRIASHGKYRLIDIYAKYPPECIVVRGKTYALLRKSSAAVVTSGTATLEAAMLNIPQIVCYKTDILTYYLAKKLVKLEWISLVNIILNKMAVTELIQEDMNRDNLRKELQDLLYTQKQKDILDAYQSLHTKIKGDQVSSKVADFILNNI